MKLLLRTRLGRRFLSTFFLLSLPVIAAGWFSIRGAIDTLRKQTHVSLRIASDGGGYLTRSANDYIVRMKTAVLRMDRLICDMLRYRSLLHADVPLSSVNVVELVRKIIEDNPILKSRRASIEIDEKIPPMRGNPAVLAQCLTALLDNASNTPGPECPRK
jgi:light-regulated signal transduction histidine kinase (bacteriophytochrome)